MAPPGEGGEPAWRDEAAARAGPPSPSAQEAGGAAAYGFGSARALGAAAQLRPEPLDFKLAARRQQVLDRAAGAGLLGVHTPVADVFTGQPSAGELRRLEGLRAGARQVTFEGVDPGRLQSALTHYELWRAEAPTRVAFLPPAGAGSPGRLEAARYNEESLRLYAASCLARGSLQLGRQGEPIAPATVSGYVSTLRALLSRDGGVNVLAQETKGVVPALMRGVRRMRPAQAPRRKRRGLRGALLRRVARSRGFDRKHSWWARRRWCMLLAGYALLARGCELGHRAGRAFDPSRGLRWRDVQWHAVGRVARRHAACTVHLCAAKDGEGHGRRYPVPIRRLAAGRSTGGGVCAYDALAAAWEEDVRLLGKAAALDAPIFRRSARGGVASAVSTTDVREAVREAVRAVGEPASDFGAHSLRIGAATDMRDLLGAEAGRAVIKGRGRWRSDIYEIYTRADMGASLDASAHMAGVNAVEVEAVFGGWADPA